MAKPVVTIHQPSMTEWFAAIGDVEAANAFREEDNRRSDRLETLFQEMRLPYERPEIFEARDLKDLSPAFAQILADRGAELCAIRLVPKDGILPKLRQRGLSLRDCYEQWFLKQEIDLDAYMASVYPHSETLLWSATFVVSDEHVFGEIIRGLHSQLTHGETVEGLRQFDFDFSQWRWSDNDPEAAEKVSKMLNMICVPERSTQESLKEKLSSEFSHDYLKGYFEVTVWPDGNIYFIDYNRVLPRYFTSSTVFDRSASTMPGEIRGAIAQPGRTTGRVVIVTPEQIESVDFQDGDILVCENTDVRFLPLMKRAGAIVTDRGGILSHAAIVSRELKKPCLIGTKLSTTTLKTGDMVEVDAERGVVCLRKDHSD